MRERAGCCEKKRKKDCTGVKWLTGHKVNEIFMNEFDSKENFYEWNFVVTCGCCSSAW